MWNTPQSANENSICGSCISHIQRIDVYSDLPEILCISVERLVKLRNKEKVQTCHRENTTDMILLRTSVISNAFNVVQRDKARRVQSKRTWTRSRWLASRVQCSCHRHGSWFVTNQLTSLSDSLSLEHFETGGMQPCSALCRRLTLQIMRHLVDAGAMAAARREKRKAHRGHLPLGQAERSSPPLSKVTRAPTTWPRVSDDQATSRGRHAALQSSMHTYK